MSDNLKHTLRTALQKLALQQTSETLGDRTTYLGASDIAACPRKTILARIAPSEPDLVTLLRFRRGHMAEDIVADAFTAAGFTNFERQVEVIHDGEVPLKAHIDFVFTSEAAKTKAVLEVKSPESIPEQPYGSWEMQLYLQMGLLARNSPGYTVEKGAILAINFGSEGLELFNGYTPQATILDGLLDRAQAVWTDYRKILSNVEAEPATEVTPLCGFCDYISTCPQFDADEVPELADKVEILTMLQEQQKNLEADISNRKGQLLAIASQRGPFKAYGRLLQKTTRNRKAMNMERLAAFLKEYGHSPDEFKEDGFYSFLEIKKAA